MLHVSFSIVEDGIMVQISHVGSDKPDETVYIKWIENDQSVNAG